MKKRVLCPNLKFPSKRSWKKDQLVGPYFERLKWIGFLNANTLVEFLYSAEIWYLIEGRSCFNYSTYIYKVKLLYVKTKKKHIVSLLSMKNKFATIL